MSFKNLKSVRNSLETIVFIFLMAGIYFYSPNKSFYSVLLMPRDTTQVLLFVFVNGNMKYAQDI